MENRNLSWKIMLTLNEDNNPEPEQILLADPTIFNHDITYYIYGTSQGEFADKGLGFLLFTSDELENWRGLKVQKKVLH